MPRYLRDRTVRLMRYLASFAKSNWQLGDYPIRVRENVSSSSTPATSRLKPIRWSAQIMGWWTLLGHGDTSQAALDQLESSFEAYRASGKTLPRPGTDVPIEIAGTDRLAAVESLAPKFFQEILELNYADCLITDESSLWDFHSEPDNESLMSRIADVYGVNVRDIESGNLVDILERIRLLSSAA